jgi:hypothetical protein
VQVPAAVTNKSGEHEHGLSRATSRFSIQSFEEIEATPVPLTAPTTQSGEFSNLSATAQGPHLVTVVVLDTVISRSGLRRDFAEMTGGRAFYNSNDLVGGFKQPTTHHRII